MSARTTARSPPRRGRSERPEARPAAEPPAATAPQAASAAAGPQALATTSEPHAGPPVLLGNDGRSRRAVTVYLPDPLADRLLLHCIEQDRDMSNLVGEAVEVHLDKRLGPASVSASPASDGAPPREAARRPTHRPEPSAELPHRTVPSGGHRPERAGRPRGPGRPGADDALATAAPGELTRARERARQGTTALASNPGAKPLRETAAQNPGATGAPAMAGQQLEGERRENKDFPALPLSLLTCEPLSGPQKAIPCPALPFLVPGAQPSSSLQTRGVPVSPRGVARPPAPPRRRAMDEARRSRRRARDELQRHGTVRRGGD